MPAVPPTPRVKMRTATRRVPRTRNAEAEHSEAPDPEPSMRLSRAILVMLLLHVVAVGGILAFSLIKERGHSHPAAGPGNNAVEAEDSDAPPAKVEHRDVERSTPNAGASLTRVANDPSVNGAPSNAANDAAERIAGARSTNSVSSNAGRDSHLPADSGKTYQVHKGESIYVIAEKLKVETSALLKLNGIDDPKKLQPGQTLRVPAAPHAKTK